MNNLNHDSHLPNVRAYVQDSTNVRPLRAPGATPYQHDRKERSDSAPRKFVAKGHDAQLQDAQFSGREVRVATMGGDLIFGKIVRRDKFTITLEVTQGTETGALEIIYKHGIESVQVKKPTASEQVQD